MEQINKKHFYYKQKEKSTVYVCDKQKVYKVNRKRKREYSEFDPSSEKVKKYKQKRQKLLNKYSIKEKNKC